MIHTGLDVLASGLDYCGFVLDFLGGRGATARPIAQCCLVEERILDAWVALSLRESYGRPYCVNGFDIFDVTCMLLRWKRKRKRN